jgi:hypothetical protein
MQIPFDVAQGRLSTPLKYASLRMTGLFFDMNLGDRTAATRTNTPGPAGALVRRLDLFCPYRAGSHRLLFTA